MSEAQKQQAAEAFWSDPDGRDQQLEAMVLLAGRLKARPQFVRKMPLERRVKHLVQYVGMPDLLASRLLVAYHLTYQRPMMARFLDEVGVAHDNGLISEDPEAPVDTERIAAGVSAIRESYPAEDVELYLATLLAQEPEIWGGIEEQLAKEG